MLRETKVGIVVTCSFLSLVGVVVSTKLRERSAAKAAATEQTAAQQSDSTARHGEASAPAESGVARAEFKQPGPPPALAKEIKPRASEPSEPSTPPAAPTEPASAPPALPPSAETEPASAPKKTPRSRKKSSESPSVPSIPEEPLAEPKKPEAIASTATPETPKEAAPVSPPET